MKTNKPFISIIIPCYNEKENLQRGVLREVYKFLKRQDFTWEVIISDDGSTDGSIDLIEKEIERRDNLKLIKNNHGGKPWAIWKGIKEAKGENVLFADMDQSTPISEVLKLIKYLAGFEVVIGSRGLERKKSPFLRKLGSVAFRTLRKAILLRKINDTQCGFKAFNAEVALKIFPLLEFFKKKEEAAGWRVTSFDVELLFLAEKYGYRIKEVEVKWEDRDVSKGKKRSYLKESKEMLAEIVRVKVNDLKGLYQK